MTFLFLFNIQDNDAVRQLKKLLVDKCREFTSKENTAEFTEVMEGPHSVGFLISERFINIPPQIAVPVYKTLRYVKHQGMFLSNILDTSESVNAAELYVVTAGAANTTKFFFTGN